MLDHVDIRVADRGASLRFYGALLGALGCTPLHEETHVDWGAFSIVADGRPVARHLDVAFAAASPAEADAARRAALDAGGADAGDGALRDPDGHRVEVVPAPGHRLGGIAHLRLRTADVGAIRRFYAVTDLGLAVDEPGHVQVGTGAGAVSYLAGDPPAAHVHLAFRVATRAAVDAFHRALVAAGHPDNGAPGERPAYHPGYYGAFVLDPDGHNVEAVDHGPRRDG